MRHAVLMVLLALALPLGAFADSIGFVDSGILGGSGANVTQSGSISANATYMLTVPLLEFTDNASITATGGTVILNTGTLTKVAPGEFSFTGTVTVENSSSTVLFTSSVTDGLIVKSGGAVSINGDLNGGHVQFSISALTGGHRMVTGNGNAVAGVTTPELGTLSLLGTGLIGIACLARKKKIGQLPRAARRI